MSTDVNARTSDGHRWFGLLPALPWLAAAGYLGGATGLVQLLLMMGGVLLPATALISERLRRTGIDDELGVCAAAVLALLTGAPLFYARRMVPIPHLAFDVIVAGVLFGAAFRSGALARCWRVASSTAFRPGRWLLAVIIPAVFALVWLGFEVRRGGVVRYYGLFVIDFSNLSNLITMMKASPGLPLFASAGSGTFYYHWWYFGLPAWLSDFAGLHCRNTSALIMCNLLAASVLVATLCAAIAQHLAGRADLSADDRRRAIARAVAIVAIAPFSLYAYQFLVAHLHQSWFGLGVRNSLLLSPLNSMTTFGNNTLALAAVLTIGAAVRVWNDRPSFALGALISLLSVAVIGLSVTVAMALVLALGVWVVAFAEKRGRFLAVAIPISFSGLVVLRLTHVFGGSGDRLGVAFDHGQFLQNIVFATAPVWLVAAAALPGRSSVTRRWNFHALLIGAGILIPTFLRITGTRADPSVMSMKIASMLIVAAAPFVANGVVALPRRMLLWRAAALAAVAIGLFSSAAYAGQFAVYRAFNRGKERPTELPAAYVDALDYVRRETPSDALIVDPSSNIIKLTISTLLVGERRVWLPTPFGSDIAGVDAENPRIRVRTDIWRDWERGGFRDEATAAAIAAEADFIVGPPTIASASWKKIHDVDGYSVYGADRSTVSRQPE